MNAKFYRSSFCAKFGAKPKEVDMRRIAIGITGVVVLLLAGIFAWNAKATSLTGIVSVHPGLNYSLVEKAACGGGAFFARCEPGLRWSGEIDQCVPCALICAYPKCIRPVGGSPTCVLPGTHGCPAV